MPVNGSFQNISACGTCLQNPVGTRFITFDGGGSSGIVFLGESPWLDEVRLGKPFSGAAGALLDSQLRRAGLTRSVVTVSNVMWCKPPYLDWVGKHPDSAIALEQCKPYWQKLIEVMKPKVIVTLGAVAMRQVLGVDGLDNRQSYVHDSPWGCPVVPTYHPAFILRGNHKLTQALFFAIARAKEVAQAGWTRQPVEYLMDPPVEQAREYLYSGTCEGGAPYRESAPIGARDALPPDQPNVLQWVTRPWQQRGGRGLPRIPLLIGDIETPESSKLDEEDTEDADVSYTIIRAGFSVRHGTACSFPWHEPYISLYKEAVAEAAVFSVHNADGFELPRLAYNGVLWRGEVHDTMWMWHFLQSDMRKGLGFIAPFFTDLPPWKHLNEADPPYYNCCDNDAQHRCYVAIRRALEQAGRWQRFVRHCIRASEVFRRPSVGRLHIDRAAQGPLKERLQREAADILALLQTEVPDNCKPRKVYKTDRAMAVDEDKARWQVVEKPCSCQRPSPLAATDIEEIKL